MKIAIVGAGIVGSTAAYYLSKRLQYLIMVLGKQPRQQQGLSAPGFPSVVIRPGIAWPVWEPIFTKI